MRKWLNCELSKSEWEKTRVFLKENNIRHEVSECGTLVHIEVLVNNSEAAIINDFLNTL